jgi:hypothetical protein
MTSIDGAIRRLSFAEARSSNAEALITIARHRAEVERATATREASEDQKTAEFLDRARQLRRVDKTA